MAALRVVAHTGALALQPPNCLTYDSLYGVAACVLVRPSCGLIACPAQADVFPDRDHFGRIFFNQVCGWLMFVSFYIRKVFTLECYASVQLLTSAERKHVPQFTASCPPCHSPHQEHAPHAYANVDRE